MYVGRNTRLEEDPRLCHLEEWKLCNSSDIHHGGQANKQWCSHGMALSVTGKTRVSEAAHQRDGGPEMLLTEQSKRNT